MATRSEPAVALAHEQAAAVHGAYRWVEHRLFALAGAWRPGVRTTPGRACSSTRRASSTPGTPGCGLIASRSSTASTPTGSRSHRQGATRSSPNWRTSATVRAMRRRSSPG